MDKSISKKIMLRGEFEDVIELKGHYFLVNKKDRVAVLPYTISADGLLSEIGVIEDWNYIEEENVLTLINDYLNEDDSTDLVAANRILFEVTGVNITTASDWMYLGSVYSNMTSDSPIKLYCVDITNIQIREEVEEKEQRKKFKMMDSSKVIQTDDILFLAAFLRLFNTFYVKSLSPKN